jgi:hypothetical protein
VSRGKREYALSICAYFAVKLVFDYSVIWPLIEISSTFLPKFAVSISKFYYLSFLIANCFRPALMKLVFQSRQNSLEWNRYSIYPIVYKALVVSLVFWKLDKTFEIDLWQSLIYGYIALPFYIYPYNFFHRKAHIHNTIWSVHKSHHFSSVPNEGDNGSITVPELSFILFTSFDAQTHTQNIWRFSTLLYTDIHQLDSLKEHDLHHYFHNENLPVPTDFASMMPVFCKQFTISLPNDAELKKTLLSQIRPTLKFYTEEQNNLEDLNQKILPFKKFVEPYRLQ